jgi:hypothetical protein
VLARAARIVRTNPANALKIHLPVKVSAGHFLLQCKTPARATLRPCHNRVFQRFLGSIEAQKERGTLVPNLA